MMGTPQLITAIVGGAIGLIIIKMLLKRNVRLED